MRNGKVYGDAGGAGNLSQGRWHSGRLDGSLRRSQRDQGHADHHQEPIHSSRSSIDGSTDSARRAGIQVASSPSNDIARSTPANTSGSRGVA